MSPRRTTLPHSILENIGFLCTDVRNAVTGHLNDKFKDWEEDILTETKILKDDYEVGIYHKDWNLEDSDVAQIFKPGEEGLDALIPALREIRYDLSPVEIRAQAQALSAHIVYLAMVKSDVERRCDCMVSMRCSVTLAAEHYSWDKRRRVADSLEAFNVALKDYSQLVPRLLGALIARLQCILNEDSRRMESISTDMQSDPPPPYEGCMGHRP